MKGIADLLYLQRRARPRQIPSTEMWLAKCQVQEHAIALSKNPTCESAKEPVYNQML